MVETRWGTGMLIFILGALQCQGTPFHPMSTALASSSSSSSEGKGASPEPSSEEAYFYKYLAASHDPDASPILLSSEESEETSKEAEKRARNFLRFGRVPQNFLRFGRGGSPLEYAVAPIEPTEEEVKRARNFLRFGRTYDKNYLRFGRANDRNFLRFGRSIDSEPEELESTNLDDKARSSYHVQTKIQSQTPKNDESKMPKMTSSASLRSKRSVPSYYNDLWLAPPTSLTWDTSLADLVIGHHSQDGSNSNDALPKASKRGQHRSFLRYGRDPLDLHFLRFGKRSPDESDPSESEDEESRMTRLIRSGANRNFLRFG